MAPQEVDDEADIPEALIEMPRSELDEFGMPVWMECSWRRITCGKVTCLLCRMQFAMAREAGEGPLAAVPEDQGPSRAEAMAAIHADASARGFGIANLSTLEEEPEPEAFPLYTQVNAWREVIMVLVREAHDIQAPWLESEAGKDLVWYAGTITAKTYRQLTNRWDIAHGSDYGEEDYRWTQYVLRESCALIRAALTILLDMPYGPKAADLLVVQSQLEQIEPATLEI